MRKFVGLFSIVFLALLTSCKSSQKSTIDEAQVPFNDQSIFNCTQNTSATFQLCVVKSNMQENNFISSTFFLVIENRTKDVVFSEKIINSYVGWENDETIEVNQTAPRPTVNGSQYGYKLNIKTLEKVYYNKTNVPEKAY